MENSTDKTLAELVEFVKSLISRRNTEPANYSRDFWMPDHSCRVCYECDTQFTIINRRHHCRLCGRVFCGKCTANSIPVPSAAPKNRDDCDRIRVCSYCFKQWELEVASVVVHNGNHGQSRKQQGRLSPTISTTSFTSTKSSATGNSNSSFISSVPYSAGNYQFAAYGSGLSIDQSSQMDLGAAPDNKPDGAAAVAASTSTTTGPTGEDTREASPDPFEYCMNRSEDDDEDDDIYGYGVYRSNSEPTHFPRGDDYYAPLEDGAIDCVYGPHKLHSDEENNITKDSGGSLVNGDLDCQVLEDDRRVGGEENGGQNNGDECDTASVEGVDAEPLDFENNGLLWLPPEPEDLEDDREAVEFGDGDDDEDAAGEWKTLRSCSSFGSGEYRSRDRSTEEHKKAMKNEVDKHFKALVSQLLQVENLIVGEEGDKESWLEIITSLSLEAATVLKPDTSEGGGMDPGGYVKIKCLACGRRTESIVVKGVVCKKNVSNRRMTSKIEKPRFLILGGALEYQRVSNHLSSFDTLLQQETDHLKMAVAKIVAHHPNVLLVEKSVSRFAQEYLFEKDISLVLNIKRPLLERVARCTGAQIVPSIDHLSAQKPGYCEAFHVEKFLEAHGSAGQGGKKLVKTLMFFEGCPKPLGCTILLKGANGDELKKVKHVLHYSVFAAYHLALETSFLADEGASLPELPLKSPITIALPDKPSGLDRSISTIPGFAVVPTISKPQGSLSNIDSQSEMTSPVPPCKTSLVFDKSSGLSKFPTSEYTEVTSSLMAYPSSSSSLLPTPANYVPGPLRNEPYEGKHKTEFQDSMETDASALNICLGIGGDPLAKNAELLGGKEANDPHINETATFRSTSFQQDRNHLDDPGCSKEDFPPSPSDHQSILVSLSIRSVWKGTVCERAHLLRMKYYGRFDKTLGRFLRDDLFAQSYRCSSCEMPSEAHVHSYTHRHGSLTISVKKFPEFLLPGERDGKIWMWHRCLLCPRLNGFPPAIRRVVMSEPARGLSFGKFLELSFSNHAAANRVANCGHSLHRDCLRFYGFGNMVACFRYASINVHSVYLPPSKLDFSCGNPEWLQKEVNQVVDRAELLFTEVLNALRQIATKKIGTVSVKVAESRRHIGDLEELLQKEKVEFEESLQKVINRGVRKGEIATDILEINRLRVQLLFHSYVWDQRLIRAAKSYNSSLQEGLNSSIQKCTEESLSTTDKLVSTNSISKQGDSTLTDARCDKNSKLEGSGEQVDSLPNDNTTRPHLSSSLSLKAPADPLETGIHVRRAISEGQFPIVANLEAAWTGENMPGSMILELNGSTQTEVAADSLTKGETDLERLKLEKNFEDLGMAEVTESHRPVLPMKVADTSDENTGWIGMPFLNLYRSYNKSSSENNTSKLEPLNDYNPVYVSSFYEPRQGGSRFILPIGANETVVPIYDEEATSIIAHALVSKDYYVQMSDEWERPKDGAESSVLLPLYDSLNLQSPFQSFEETASESLRSLGTMDSSILSMSGSRSTMISDPLVYTKASHVRVAFSDDGPLGKVKYAVTCYYAKGFEALRRTCCPSELDFVRSLSRCSDWNAQGGKSNAYFAKSLDDRFIIKGLTKTELESFIKFAPEYFKYLSESISTRSPTCLAKILGVYQVTTKHLKGGKEQKMDVLVMENLLFKRKVTRLYDLKGSSRSRYNPDASGKNKVLLDQNLIEAMPTSPIFLGNKAKRLLERAVWNDTSFLASIDVMDYSLLVGVDEEKNELVLGIIDFIRQYTWDKHLETWVKASGFLGGSKNESPTVISPKQYKKRFRKAMSTYFLMVPDQWSPPTIIPSSSQSDLESLHGAGTSHD